jgi:hypothetical protein
MRRTWRTDLSRTALALAGALCLAPAASQALEISGIARLGYDFGGDTLAAVPSVSSTSTEKIRANEGPVVAAGVSLLNDARNFAVEATLGWKSADYNGSIQKYEFSRVPLDVLAFYSFPLGEQGKSQLRFGAGPTLHIDPKLVESGSLADNTTRFDNALGFVAQVDVLFVIARGRAAINAGLRYTSVNYEANGIPTIKGDGPGIFVGGRFPIGL